jgi:hypothetical protein
VSARVIAGHPAEPADSVAAMGSVGLEPASVASGAWVAVGAAGAHAETTIINIMNDSVREYNLFFGIFSSRELIKNWGSEHIVISSFDSFYVLLPSLLLIKSLDLLRSVAIPTLIKAAVLPACKYL